VLPAVKKEVAGIDEDDDARPRPRREDLPEKSWLTHVLEEMRIGSVKPFRGLPRSGELEITRIEEAGGARRFRQYTGPEFGRE
jgi:hypothetical protein